MSITRSFVAQKLRRRVNGKIHVLEVLGNAIVGGMEAYVRNLIVHLPREKFEISVLSPFESAYTRSLRDVGCQVYIAPLRDDPPWRAIEMVGSLITHYNVDVLHAHLMNAHTVAAIAGSFTGTPTVATIHGMNFHPQEASLIRLAGTHTIVVCREAWSQAIAFGLQPENLTLISNGVNLAIFNPQAAPRSVLRETIGVRPDEVLIGFVGRLAWEKGPDKFLKAAERILHYDPRVKFVLAGTGAMESELNLQIARMGIGKSVHMAGVWAEPQKLYPALDLMLHTSRADAMPLAMLEAMACGVPIIGLNVGGIPELIETGVSGILIGTTDWPGIVSQYSGDWEGIAEAAIHLIGQPALRERMSRASVQRAEDLYDIRKSAGLTASVFAELVGASAGKNERDAVLSAGKRLSSVGPA